MSAERCQLLAFLTQVALALPRKLARLWRGGSSLFHGQVILGESAWNVDVAITRTDRYVGLGKRERIEPGTGMLFLYPFTSEREFTMRGCLVPLDIAFLDSHRRVVAMFTMDVDADRVERRKYTARAQYILEVPAGSLAQARVEVGNVASFSDDVPVSWRSDP